MKNLNLTFNTSVQPKVREAKTKEIKPIFETAIRETRAKIELAITELHGRYGENATPHARFSANPLWTVTNHGENTPVNKEKIKVSLKVGKILWQIGFGENSKGETVPAYHLPGCTYEEAVQFFNDGLAWIDGMTKDSPDAEKFHELAKKAALPTTNRSTYVYDEVQDIWVQRDSLKAVS